MEFAVAASDERDWGLTVDLLFRVDFDFVADEGGDFAQVEVGEQHCDNDLGGAEAAHAAAAGGFDLFGAAALYLVVEGLDAVSRVGVKLVPFLGSVFECLGGAAVVGSVEGHGVLGADFVLEVREIFTVD
ncbi:hypothetical protein [Cryobacterium sp. Y57]|uniref:hypothetical protein n=1 Tax=Cryobacterium sp. Y57 TaxID=2048287 RepID=UPI0011AFE88C|nr:hypothetical protein [Cryobacterium sp. Y57]